MKGEASPAKATGTTALPNALFDLWLPTLGDTELRVLLVVARSTLGWKEGAGRKERDWLSHAQLCRRTGRSNTPVSGAVDSLVRRGLLLVQDEAGRPQTTATQRRAARSRLFFRLGSALLAPLPIAPEETSDPAKHLPRAHEDGPSMAGAAPRSGIQFVETTKETGTKFLKNELSFPQSGITSEESGIEEEKPKKAQDLEEGMQRVREAFEQAYRAARPNEPIPSTDDEDALALLGNYVERGYGEALETWLPAFFASSFGFVKRRNYSLRAYLDCFFVLQSRAGTPRVASNEK